MTTAPANLRESRYLDRWVSRAKDDLNLRLGHGGPALTSAAFTAGIADVRNVIETTNEANRQAERDRRNVTFEDKYGAALAWCPSNNSRGNWLQKKSFLQYNVFLR